MATPIAPVPVCWPLPFEAETVTSDPVSAACYGSPEDIGIVAVVVMELEFRWQPNERGTATKPVTTLCLE